MHQSKLGKFIQMFNWINWINCFNQITKKNTHQSDGANGHHSCLHIDTTAAISHVGFVFFFLTKLTENFKQIHELKSRILLKRLDLLIVIAKCDCFVKSSVVVVVVVVTRSWFVALVFWITWMVFVATNNQRQSTTITIRASLWWSHNDPDDP